MSERENSKNDADDEEKTIAKHAEKSEEAFQKFVEKVFQDKMQVLPDVALYYLSLSNEPTKNRVRVEYLKYYFMIKDLVKIEKDFFYQTKIKAVWIKNIKKPHLN